MNIHEDAHIVSSKNKNASCNPGIKQRQHHHHGHNKALLIDCWENRAIERSGFMSRHASDQKPTRLASNANHWESSQDGTDGDGNDVQVLGCMPVDMLSKHLPHLCKHSMVAIKSHPTKMDPVRGLYNAWCLAVVATAAAIAARACCCSRGISLTASSPDLWRDCADAMASQARVKVQQWYHGSSLKAKCVVRLCKARWKHTCLSLTQVCAHCTLMPAEAFTTLFKVEKS